MRHSRYRVGRLLDTSEAIFHAYAAQGAFLIVHRAALRGPLTEDLLRRALGHVQERHPLLRARIRGGSAPCWFTPEPGPLPLRVLPPGTDPQQVAEAELHRIFDVENESLWRCTFIPGPKPEGDHHLVLAFHHAVTDGRSAALVLMEVLSACAAFARNEAPSPWLAVGSCLDDVLPPRRVGAAVWHRLRHLRARFTSRPTLFPQDVPPQVRRTAFVPRGLGQAQTAALVEAARIQGATVTGVLSAALLESVLAQRGPVARLSISHGVCMRVFGNPPIPAEQVGCFVSEATTTHELAEPRPFWEVAREATAHLRTTLARGEPLAGIHASRGRFALVARAAQSAAKEARAERIGNLSISNIGVVPCGALDPFTLDLWSWAVSNHIIGSSLQLSCGTLEGKFSYALVYVEPLFTRAAALAIVDAFHASLARVAEGG